MTAHPAASPPVTEEEYIARDAASEQKSEYLRGEVFAMAGGSPRHNKIAANLARAFPKEMTCDIFSSDQRVQIPVTGLFTYADLTIVCGPLQMHPQFATTLLNPSLLFEVLSPSTEAYDRGAKFAHYRRIASLEEYVLVSQAERLVEHFQRDRREELIAGGDRWLLTTWSAPETHVPLPSLGLRLALADIYARVELLDPTAPEDAALLPRPKTLT